MWQGMPRRAEVLPSRVNRGLNINQVVMGSGCFEPRQVVPGRMFSGIQWDSVLNEPTGEGFYEVNSANALLVCHCCLWSEMGLGCPVALYREVM